MPRRKPTNPDGTPVASRGYTLSDDALEQRRSNARNNAGRHRTHSCKHAALNALKHGGYSQAEVLPTESGDATQDRINVFITSLGAATTLERRIAAHAAHHPLRLERLLGASDARLEQQVQKAQTGRHAERTREAAAWGERLLESPAEAVSHLETFAQGCEHLLAEWRVLEGGLIASTVLWHSQWPRALALCGKRPGALFHDVEVWRWTRYYLGSIVGPAPPFVPPADAGNLLEHERPAGMTELEWTDRVRYLVRDRPGRDESVAGLRALVAAKIDALEARLPALVAHEAVELRLAVASAACDDSPAGGRRHREAASLQRMQYQAMDRVMALRRARLAGELEPTPPPTDPVPGPCPGSESVAEVCRNGTKSAAEAEPEMVAQVSMETVVTDESPPPATPISSPRGTKSAGTKSGDEIGPPLAPPAPGVLLALPAPAPAPAPGPVAPAPVADPEDPIARPRAESPVVLSGPPERWVGQNAAGDVPARPRPREDAGGTGPRIWSDHYPRDD